MKPAILLIDLQQDFLAAPSLDPTAGQVVERAARLLAGARAAAIPIIHVWTTVDPNHDGGMPHWRRTGKRACVLGTPGHATPPAVRPAGAETIIHKTFFSAFAGDQQLERVLKSLEVDTLVLAGVHVHGCIRATVLDGYQRGFTVWVAEDAIGSDDPLHAAITRRYLAARAARFMPVEVCLAAFGRKEGLKGPTSQDQVPQATDAAKRAWLKWRATEPRARAELFHRLSGLLLAQSPELARSITAEIGKPIVFAEAELTRAIALLKTAGSHANEPLEVRCTADSIKRHRPLGVIAVITPWNNPVAIPLGKIAPALIYGNAVVWKPGPAGASIALKLMELFRQSGFPEGLVNLVRGDRTTAMTLMADPEVDAVTLTGSAAAGYSAQDICGRRHVPLQAELGGNNAAIIGPDGDLEHAANAVADGAFAFAGQRCTANRRVIVDASVYERFIELLRAATAGLVCGDPLDPNTRVGPLISQGKCDEAAAAVERARSAGCKVITPHNAQVAGAFFPPTIVCCEDPAQEIVQEETFGPVLVVQKANGADHALRLCNGVRHGLVASLFSKSETFQEQFLEQAQAGILKINQATADANAEAPFGGWKASGLGPPEHGASNREFYTRTQAVYGAER